MKAWTSATRLAEQTPSERNRYVDFLRAASILVVVIGHWLMAAPEVGSDGTLRAGHLLSLSPWTHGLTWVLQVMPIFFFVGGYSHAVAWRAARRDGIGYPTWLRARLQRLLTPVLPLLAVWTVFAALALPLGLDPWLLRIGSQAALVPVWFLAVYMLICVTAPLTIRAWERWGWIAFGALAATAALIDVASIGFGVGWVTWVNFMFVWNAVHMLGYAWADGHAGSVRQRLGLATGGLAAVATMVTVGPYPVAMVGLDGETLTNSSPPRVTLVALGLFQFGLALSAEAPMRRWLGRLRPWTTVVAINGSIMSLYLWHLTVMVLAVGGLLLAGGVGLHLTPATAEWWATRVIWVAALATLMLPVLALIARFERPAPDRRPAPRTWRPVTAALASCAGLGLLALAGVADAGGINGVAVGLPFAGALGGGIVRRRQPTDGAHTSSRRPEATS